MAGAYQMLLPFLDPAHGASGQSGQKGNQQVFGVNVSLGAEASAHIKSYAADARFGQLQERGRLSANGVHHLCRGPDGNGIGPLVISADHTTALHGDTGIAMRIEATSKFEGGTRESSRYLTLFNGKLADQIGRKLFMYDLRPWFQGGLRID